MSYILRWLHCIQVNRQFLSTMPHQSDERVSISPTSCEWCNLSKSLVILTSTVVLCGIETMSVESGYCACRYIAGSGPVRIYCSTHVILLLIDLIGLFSLHKPFWLGYLYHCEPIYRDISNKGVNWGILKIWELTIGYYLSCKNYTVREIRTRSYRFGSNVAQYIYMELYYHNLL